MALLLAEQRTVIQREKMQPTQGHSKGITCLIKTKTESHDVMCDKMLLTMRIMTNLIGR